MKHLLKIALLFTTVVSAQHTLSGTFTPPQNFSYVFLYKSTPNGSNYIDRLELDEKGNFNFTLDSTQTKGIYKVVYAIPPEKNNFDVIYNEKEDIALTYSTVKGVNFTQSEENKLWISYLKSTELVNTSIAEFYTDENAKKKDYLKLIKTLKETQQSYEDASKNLMINPFITSSKPYIPTDYEDLETYYNNVRTHYFDSVNFNDPLLQSSNFLNDRIYAFVFAMIPNANTNFYKKQVDVVVQAISNESPEMQTVYLEAVWQEFVNKQNDEMANYITDTYLAALAKNTQNANLLNIITVHKNTSIGALAPDFKITYTKNEKELETTLHQLPSANKYLLIFWSSTCGHCLSQLPLVHKHLEGVFKKDVTVVAFGLESDEKHWKETILELPNFIHTIGLNKWSNPIPKKYGVHATPTYFVLDKNKNIIAKPESLKALKELLLF